MVRFFIVAVESLLRDLHSQPSGDRLMVLRLRSPVFKGHVGSKERARSFDG